MTKPKRAQPLPPAERRRVIIEAVLPLLAERGRTATTREMAEAAGVAEGTLFTVFPNKRAIIRDAIKYRMDPEPLRRELAGAQTNAPLGAQLAEAGRILLGHFEEVTALTAVLHTMPSSEKTRAKEPPAFVLAWGQAIRQGLTELLEPHRSSLRLAPAQVAEAFTGLLISNSRPVMYPRERLSTEEIVDLLLHGAYDASKGEPRCS